MSIRARGCGRRRGRGYAARVSRVLITSFDISPLEVRLLEPFVIATGRMDATRSALVGIALSDDDHEHRGIGEGACLPPVTSEDLPDVLASLRSLSLIGTELTIDHDFSNLRTLLAPLDDRPVARTAVECALLDALARRAGVPLRTLLGGELGARTTTLRSDITIPIHTPQRMGELAHEWWARGFRSFKIKVGKDLDDDVRALEAVVRATPEAGLRLDANGGFSARSALTLTNAIARLGARLECFEQPCARDDLEGSAEVAAALEAPVIADESVRSLDDLARVIKARAADGVNLKLVKTGGPLSTRAIGVAARAAGLSLMFGGMVETRLGMSTAAQVAASLGGVEFADLDTAWLLVGDPMQGGYHAEGERYTLDDEAGIGVRTA